jgi:hypothetical protein
MVHILTLKGHTEGVYSIIDDYGDQIIPMFEEEDDALRYSIQLKDQQDHPELQIVEIEKELFVAACIDREQKFAFISKDDFIVPPKPFKQ